MSKVGSRSAAYRPLTIALVIGLLLTISGVGLESASAWSKSRLVVSSSPDRSGPVLLDGSTVEGEIYVFVQTFPVRSSGVEFYLDDPDRTLAPVQVDRTRPFDFAGTAAGRVARPYDTLNLSEGSHSITAVLER